MIRKQYIIVVFLLLIAQSLIADTTIINIHNSIPLQKGITDAISQLNDSIYVANIPKSKWDSLHFSLNEKIFTESKNQNNSANKLTWLALIITVFQSAIFIIQTVYFNRQTKSLENTIEKMDDIAQRQLRAYLNIEFISAPKNHKKEFHFQIKNFGQTPAYKVKFWTLGRLCAFPVENVSPPNFPDPIGQTPLTIPPGGTSDIILTNEILKSYGHEIEKIKSDVALAIWGKIEYEDIYGRSWHTKYCFIYSEEFLNTNNIAIHTQHNESN